jgi:hypothetical protein
MEQKAVVFVAMDVSGTPANRINRLVNAITGLEHAQRSVWATAGAVVACDGIDALPQVSSCDNKTVANVLSRFRSAARLGILSQFFREENGQRMLIGQSAADALLKSAKAPKQAAPGDAANLTPAHDMEPDALLKSAKAPKQAAPGDAANLTPAHDMEPDATVWDTDEAEPTRARGITHMRRERAAAEHEGILRDAAHASQQQRSALEAWMPTRYESAIAALRRIATIKGKAGDIARATLKDLGE